MRRTTPRSCVISSMAMPSSRCRLFKQLEDLRLDGDVERRGRLVGDQQVRLVGERHGDHDALALPAGELMRVGVEPPLRVVEADLAQQLQHARAHGRHRRAPWCSFMISPTCFSMVCRGLSEVIGSWKMIEIFSPRMLAHVAARQP